MSSRTRAELLETIRRRLHDLDDPKLTVAVEDLDHCMELVKTPKGFQTAALVALRAMQDGRPGQPGAHAYDSPSVVGGSPTGSHPERMAEQIDGTAHDRRQIDASLRTLDTFTRPGGVIGDWSEWRRIIGVHAYQVRRIVDVWTPHAPTDKQRNAVARANSGDECEHHATARIVEPAEHHGTVSGNLSVPMSLCGYCYWQVRRKGRLPSGEAMERRQRTGKEEKERVW